MREEDLELTPIGWVLVPLALWFYFLKPSQLYWWMIFFIPFSATAVVNIGSGVSASGIQASMLFGSLWIAKELPGSWRASNSTVAPQLRKPARQLMIFFFVVVLSLAMPVWINGRVVIESPEFANPESTPLQFSSRYITQTLYILYGVLVTICVAAKASKPSDFMRSVRVYVMSSIFVSLWGIFQLFCYFAGVTYPAYIFNNSATPSALGYLQELESLGTTRISSVATEPSLLAQCLLLATVFVLFALIDRKPLISKFCDRFALVVIVLVLLASTSSIAYIGLAVALILYVLALWYLRILGYRHVLSLAIFGTFLLGVYALYSPARDLVDAMLLGKSESYSGIARLLSVVQAGSYFVQYPVLGLGWGSVTSHDLIFKILSNTGIMGLVAFSLFLFTVITRLWQAMHINRLRSSSATLFPVCLFITTVVLLFSNIATGFAYSYGHTWFVFGLAISASTLRPDIKGLLSDEDTVSSGERCV
jgi:hypothetical protein